MGAFLLLLLLQVQIDGIAAEVDAVIGLEEELVSCTVLRNAEAEGVALVAALHALHDFFHSLTSLSVYFFMASRAASTEPWSRSSCLACP